MEMLLAFGYWLIGSASPAHTVQYMDSQFATISELKPFENKDHFTAVPKVHLQH